MLGFIKFISLSATKCIMMSLIKNRLNFESGPDRELSITRILKVVQIGNSILLYISYKVWSNIQYK